MSLSNHFDTTILELFKQRKVMGTVISSRGSEATTVGMSFPFRPGRDVQGVLHRDLAAHLLSGMTPYALMCQFMANAESPTYGREGNVHHGDAAQRRFPMISHLGNMLAPVVGGAWAARRFGEDVFGLAVIGDGGSSTGDCHESMNIASVRKVPVLFVIENNHYAFSVPTRYQYNCENLSQRAAGYGVQGKTVDGTDVWEVYSTVCDALDYMHTTSLPYILECMTLRLDGHAAYDKAEYVSAEETASWMKREPLTKARAALQSECGLSDKDIAAIDAQASQEIAEATEAALRVGPVSLDTKPLISFAPVRPVVTEPFKARNVKNLKAVNLALHYLLDREERSFIAGQDIGPYGSAFKSCKGLIDKFGDSRVLDMPICESATVGFALGASQVDTRPIIEFQFADFATEAATQIGFNAGTWYFRAHHPAAMLLRFPCGGGITLGAFHSGEFEGLWSRFPGLKLLYPVTPQETFEALVAGFYDDNPCLVFEHKLLYSQQGGDIDFDGNCEQVWRARQYASGDKLTIICWGAMAALMLKEAARYPGALDIWNPFVLSPADLSPIIESVKKTGKLLVIQESTRTAGLGNHFLAEITRECFDTLHAVPEIICAPDMPVPFARELEFHYLPNIRRICATIDSMIGAAHE
ncbi:MAG: transketolase [Chitinivibrionales bacterium]|nr:transketolase [Chitinivibrionales bacterium]